MQPPPSIEFDTPGATYSCSRRTSTSGRRAAATGRSRSRTRSRAGGEPLPDLPGQRGGEAIELGAAGGGGASANNSHGFSYHGGGGGAASVGGVYARGFSAYATAQQTGGPGGFGGFEAQAANGAPSLLTVFSS